MAVKRQEAEYKPNYKKRCIVCSRTPTIDIHPVDGSAKVATEMCGPCTWGDSETIDPENW